MDPLLETLRGLHLTGGVFLDAAFRAPWCVLSQVEPEDCGPHQPPPPQVVAYHYVTEGGLFRQVGRDTPVHGEGRPHRGAAAMTRAASAATSRSRRLPPEDTTWPAGMRDPLDIGYESEAAFTHAFGRAFGQPPAAWRRTAREGAPRGESA